MSNILGTKLRLAREAAGLSKEDLAKGVGLSGEFISLLEKGKRKPSLNSLTALAGFLKKEMAYFLTEEESAFDRLARMRETDQRALKLFQKFQKKCEEFLYLEEITGSRLEPAPVYTRHSPEAMAREERRRLGLGEGPVADIFFVLEMNGLSVFRFPVEAELKIAGVFLFLDNDEASFALVDSNQPVGLQKVAAAHLYCHFLKDRNAGPIIDNPDIFVADYVSLYHPREQFAQKFAARFLMPPEHIEDIIDRALGKAGLDFEDVFFLKRYFGVSTFAMLQSLRDMERIPSSGFKSFKALESDRLEESLFGRVGDEDLPPRGAGREIVSDRLRRLVHEACRKNRLVERKWPISLRREKGKILKAFKS